MGSLIGWIHFKKWRFFGIEQDIVVESNPYSIDRLPPVSVPMWKFFVELAKKENLDEDMIKEMERILNNR